MTWAQRVCDGQVVRSVGSEGTPADLIARLHRDALRVLVQPEMRERLTNMGADVIVSSPDKFAAYLRSEIARYTRIVRTAGLEAE